jgi:hypothetical protein
MENPADSHEKQNRPSHRDKAWYLHVFTLWLFNIARENHHVIPVMGK